MHRDGMKKMSGTLHHLVFAVYSDASKVPDVFFNVPFRELCSIMTLPSCPQIDQLSLMISGQLPEAIAQKIWAHVAECDRCVQILDSMPKVALLQQPDFLGSLRQAVKISVEFPAPLVDLRRNLIDLPQRQRTVSRHDDHNGDTAGPGQRHSANATRHPPGNPGSTVPTRDGAA